VERPAGRRCWCWARPRYGKTTVPSTGWRRLARLADEAPDPPRDVPLRAAVIVPTPGLRRLSALLLERLEPRR